MKKVNTKKAAEILEVNPQSVRNYADNGKLKFTKTPGGHRRYEIADIQKLLKPCIGGN